MNMPIKYLLLFISVLLSNLSIAQCNSCDQTFTMPSAANYTSSNNETICLTGSGNFTGSISLDGSNSELCIANDVVFTGTLNMNKNTVEVNNFGTISGINLNTQGTFNNFGTMSLTGLSLNNGSFNNFNTTFGAVEVSGSVNVNNGTNLNIDGGLVVGGDLNVNSGGDVTLNGAGISVAGTLSVNSANSITASGSTSGCEGVTFGNLNLNNASAFSGGVDICDSDDAGSTPAPAGTSQCNCSSLLPVDFVNYSTKANYENDRVEVKWTTASEQNSTSFSIERSYNGYDFLSIGSVIAAGNSDNINNYVFYDNTPILGNSYYRIKQIDVDGTYTFTNVMVQNYQDRQSNGSMLISINNNTMQLNFSEYVEDGQLEIISSSGKLIRKRNIEVNAYTTSLKQSELSAGICIIKFRSKEKLWVNKVLIK